MEYKIPSDPQSYTVTWVDWLPSGVTVIASTWTLETGIIEDSKTNDTTTCTIYISGGVAGKVYEVVNNITGSDGRAYKQGFFLTVQKARD